MNIQGLCPQTVPSKVPLINNNISSGNHLFIGLSETWLRTHKDDELSIEGFTLFRCDSTRSKKSNRGRLTGGVAMYIRDDMAFSSEVIFSHSTDAIQLLCLYSKAENIAIITVYRQPDDKTHGHPSTPNDLKIALARLKSELQKLQPTPDIVMGGDFNLPHAVWPEGTPSQGASIDERLMLNTLNEFSNEFYLTQVVTGPTHKDGNTLDLLFVNNTALVHHCTVIPTLPSTSHHSIIQISTAYKATSDDTEQSTRPKLSSYNSLNFFSDEFDWEVISHKLGQVNWSEEFNGKSADDMLSHLYTICFDISAEHVPLKKPADLSKTNRITRYRRSLTNRRRRIVKRLSRITSPTQIDKLNNELLQIEKKLQKSFQDSATFQESKAVNAIKKNPKYFFAYANKKSKTKSKVGPLYNAVNQLTNNSKEMAELLSKQYTTVFSTPMGTTNIPKTPLSNSKIYNVIFSETDMVAVIDELKISSAAGPDGFPAILLKTCKDILAIPLTLFWRKCLNDGYIPPSLKRSLITPHHKGDSRAIPANYRPIALTSHIIKLFEKILRKHIVKHINDNNLFNKNQHGFRAGRSCLSQLLEHFDTLINMLDEGFNADVIYLDFAKAFDKLDFQIVLQKTKNMGIDGKLLKWIESFLTNRIQYVIVNGVTSDPKPVISGVPQGSVIGPLLFLILISDIDEEVLHSIVKSFADDTRATKSISTPTDTTLLQEDLNKIYTWSEKNNMMLNDVKFEGMRCGHNDALKSSTNYTTPSGTPITIKAEIKDLGVLMSDTCLFDKQIGKVIEKGNNIMSWILRTFKTRLRNPMLLLFKALVLPIIEYCSVLWSPNNVGHIQKLEALQWSFIRKITGTSNKNYWECLLNLKLYSLQRRRERYRIIYIWKVLENLVPNINGSISSYIHVRHGRKCRIPLIKANSKMSKIKESSLPIHGTKLFNALPKHVRDITNVNIEAFKTALDALLKTIPDEPLIPGYTACRRAGSNSILEMKDFRCRDPPMGEGLIGGLHITEGR